MSHRFTAAGAAQLRRDMHAISALVERYIPDGSGALGQGLVDALVLLNLPVDISDGEGGLTLKQATDRVFTDNAEAKKVMDELGVEALTPANARNILQRRVENAE